MAQFLTLAAILNIPFRPNRLLNLKGSPNRKEAISAILAQDYHMPERYERVRVGWHCAKVKGHAELKIKTKQSKDP